MSAFALIIGDPSAIQRELECGSGTDFCLERQEHVYSLQVFTVAVTVG